MGDTFIVDTFIVWFGLLTLHSVIFGEIKKCVQVGFSDQNEAQRL